MQEQVVSAKQSWSMDDVLKASVALALLIASGSVAYYYAFYLPARADKQDATIAADKVEKARAAEAQSKKAEEKSRIRRDAYRVCISIAENAYSSRWDASCKRLHDVDVRARDRCFASGLGESYCLSTYAIRTEQNCSLPSQTAQGYDLALKEAQEQCRAEASTDLLN